MPLQEIEYKVNGYVPLGYPWGTILEKERMMAKRPYIPECSHLEVYNVDCLNCLYKDVFREDQDDIVYDSFEDLQEILKYEDD